MCKKLTVEEINLIKWALNTLDDKARAVRDEGFDIGTVREDIYDVLRKLDRFQENE